MDISKLEKQADILFANTAGWNTKALKRIGRRIKSMKSLSYADLQAINNATIVNQDVNAIMEELARLTKQNVKDVYRIYGEMIAEQHGNNKKLYDYRNKPYIPFAENKPLQAIVKAYARTTSETFVGLTMSKAKDIGFVDANNNFIPIKKQFTKVLDKATMSIATGTGDFNSEMREAIKELGGSGLRVNYGGGITRRLDTMVRQNLLWGAKQASVEYNNMIGEELGCDGIEIDWHSNPRPSHEFMQGKQYILGKAKTINGVKFESADKALEALQDYGCLHFPTPIFCGISEPTYTPEELSRLNAENKRQIEIDGISKTGYEWKQTMRRLETEARKTKDQIETLKSSGDVGGVNLLNDRLKAIETKYNLVAKETGIKAQPERMSVIKSAKKVNNQKLTILTNYKVDQNFKAVEVDAEKTIFINRENITIKANKLINTKNKLYLSEKTKLKPKHQHFIDSNITEAKQIMGILDDDQCPQILIVDSSEMNFGTIASYNPVDNILRIDSQLAIEEKIPILQKSNVKSNDKLSTLIHELIHWKDAQKYRYRFGEITIRNHKDYFKWTNQIAKDSIDKLEKTGYNIQGISEYAQFCYKKQIYDEVYTEYKTLNLLGGE